MTVDETILDAALKIHNGIASAGEGFRALLPALDAKRREVFRKGGGESVEDFTAWAGADRIRADIVALLVASSFGDVLVAAAGKKDQKPEPNFYQRIAALVGSGKLTENRGPANPNPLDIPGMKSARRTVGPKAL
jgi:hypothetical protein